MRSFSHKKGKGKDRFLSALVFYRYTACWFNLSINVAVIKIKMNNEKGRGRMAVADKIVPRLVISLPAVKS